MNIMEEICETERCREILANDIKIDTTDQCVIRCVSKTHQLWSEII